MLPCQLELQQSFHEFGLMQPRQLGMTVCHDFCTDASFHLEHLSCRVF